MSEAAAFRAWVASLGPAPGEIRVEPGELATITLSAPATRNALTPQMMVAFADAVGAVAGARVVLLRGEGASFCSGGDLGAVRAHLARPGGGRLLAALMHEATEALAGGDALVVAAVDGPALGGGAELLTVADHVVAGPNAKVGWVQARLGVSPGFGGGARLVARVGPRRALALLAEARVLDAREALAAGLVDELVEEPEAHARRLAARWLALPEGALRAAKRVVRAAAGRAEALAEEARIFDGVWGSAEHLAALDRPRRP